MKKQKGIGAFEIVMIVLVIAWIGLKLYSSSSIDIEKTNELKQMIASVEKTGFESTFKTLVDEKLNDGKISNGDFEKISKAYSNYELSKINGTEREYTKGLNQPKADKGKTVLTEDEKNIVNYFVYFLYAVFGVIMLWVASKTFFRSK